MNRFFKITIFVLTTVILYGCKSSSSERTSIGISIPPLASILKELCGEDFSIITLSENNSDPETFEPTMGKRMDIDNSVAYFSLGDLLPSEKNLLGNLPSNIKVFNLIEGIELEYGTHHANAHSESEFTADPHVWTSVRNLKTLAYNMYKGLSEINPEKAEEYKARFDSFSQKLDSIDADLISKLPHEGSISFAIWHPSLSYFARDYGLEQIALGQDHKELSAMTLKALIDSAREQNVKVFFYQRDIDSRQAITANEKIGSRLVEIDLNNPNWLSQLNQIKEALAKE